MGMGGLVLNSCVPLGGVVLFSSTNRTGTPIGVRDWCARSASENVNSD
jgi:hypothetical protein